MAPPESGKGDERASAAPETEAGEAGVSLTPGVRRMRHVVWGILLGWLVLVAVVVVLVTVL